MQLAARAADIRGEQRLDHGACGLAPCEQGEALAAEGGIDQCLRREGADAALRVGTEPTAKNFVVTATPKAPLSTSRATIDQVTASPSDRAALRASPDAAIAEA